MKLDKTPSIVLFGLLALVLYSCANIGRPDGGPKDVLPPVFVRSTPTPGQLNFNGDKIEIEFDEYIQLKDQQTKVVVSPAQKNMPIIRSNGKKVSIELRDSLLPNTTYCIDFANSIQDNNEGNPLDGFSLAFSTGDVIDSLQISGVMLRARDLEPMQSIIVGIHENLHDSAFSSIPLSRIARTNDYGQFTIRNLKPGSYHLFGLKDMDGDYKFARTEDIAFIDEIIIPSSTLKQTTDTIFKHNGEIDTVQPGLHTMFLPNNLFLPMFNEEYRSLYLKKNERNQENKLHILFSAPVDTLPDLKVLKPTPSRKDWYRLQRTANNDSLFYWLTDSNMIKSDSIMIAARYLQSDSLDNHVFTTDTLKFFFRHKVKKDKDKKSKKKSVGELMGLSEEEQKLKLPGINDIEIDSTMRKSRFDSIPGIGMQIRTTMEYGDSLVISFDSPIDSIVQSKFVLEVKEDTLWKPVGRPFKLESADAISVLDFKIAYPFDAGSTYKLSVDSMAVYDCYNNVNNIKSAEFSIPPFEEYANLYMNVNVTDSAFCELLDNSEKVVKTAPVVKGVAAIENVKPGTYFVRLIMDSNGNGKWDTGNYAAHRQPEDVFYYHKKINLKKNWDVEQSWNIYEIAVDKQKPYEITKNRSKLDPRNKQNNRRNDEEDEYGEDDDMPQWGVSGMGNGYSGNKYTDSQNQFRR